MKFDIQFTPEHWNHNAQATIPAGWEVVSNETGNVVALAGSEKEALNLAMEMNGEVA